ncbi:MAG TPA: beta-ketoacyl-ACP synthase II [Oscillospiraceae bacterium]|nr:beta-ketoacyl-ACP synthase II [Oscillospiraceae bacterium]HXK78207.1 beta-ketoacyl-ACP synthase II [Oscillospiraceae bacterium]
MRRVVVTGLGCVTPVGNDVASFWSSVTGGIHGIAPITRFDASSMKVKIAAEVKNFHPELYMEKSEIRHTDLYAQYALAAAAQAVEESGISVKIAPERFGVYIGSGIGGISTSIAETQKMLEKGPEKISPFFVPMLIGNMASAMVAIRYGAKGPNLPIVTACATSTHAIGEAFRAIRYGYADAILAGGAEASINPLAIGGFANCMALSTTSDPDCASIPFDRRRNGFVMGEGAGVLVLEEYEHAKSRGAKIYCELSGYGNTCDAYHITAPQPEAEGSSRVISLAFEEAGLAPDEKLYINPHGTSTPLNDKTETLAIKRALGELAYRVPVSSTKSVTGHMLGAAGGVEAIAAVLALETGAVPPTIGYKEPDPDCDLDYVPNRKRTYDADKALSLSLGFGGHNAAILFNKI